MMRHKQVEPLRLGVHLWLSRFTGSGKVAHEINPHSGLILRRLLVHAVPPWRGRLK